MLLRRVIEHVKAQNWTAVGLDFVIVVVGVFIGIQVANWNEERTFVAKEKELLAELKLEIENNNSAAIVMHENYASAHAAAKRSIAFLDSDANCGSECWAVLIDFLNASQWFDVGVSRSIYDEMRRQSLPRSREIVSLVEAYLAQNHITSTVLTDLPAYRQHVRSLMPVAVLEAYWSTCYNLQQGVETILFENCPVGVSNDIAMEAVQRIVQHEETRTLLTFWFSEITPTEAELEEQIEAAERAIAAINSVLD